MLTMNVNLGNKMYAIHIKRGLTDQLGEMLIKTCSAEKIAVITDDNVNKLYGERVLRLLNSAGFKTGLIVVRAGEKSKSMATLQRVYQELLELKITRWDCLITLGGGVVGDLGGYAAATFLRGVPYIQVPTSLLAQIDSSVGGKVAVDLPEGKNLVGSFYHPDAVFVDPDLLNTLPIRYFNDGMAEVIKYGCIKDPELFCRLAECKNYDDLGADMEEVIFTCLDIKRTVVEGDRRDRGNRMILNFGHTLGHAIEQHYNYGTYTHGEAVAIGMYQITKSSESRGLTESGTSARIKKVLAGYKLPWEIPGNDLESIVAAITVDKKSRGSSINIVLLKTVGKCFLTPMEHGAVRDFFIN